MRILMLGNSFTFANDMPVMLAELTGAEVVHHTRGRVVQKGVYAKMARGEMVRFMAGIHAEDPEQIKTFDWSAIILTKTALPLTNMFLSGQKYPGSHLGGDYI